MRLDKKNIALLVAIAFTFLIVYRFALSTTISQYIVYQDLRKYSAVESTAIKQGLILEKKNKVLDSILSKYNLVSGSTQNQLLNILTKESDSLDYNILSFSEPHSVIGDKESTTTFMFTLEGNYIDILKSLYSIETNYLLGAIRHASFEKKIDYKTSIKRLEVSCFLEVKEFQ